MGKQIEAPHQKIKSCSETKKGEISKKGNKDDWQMQDLIFWCEAKLLLKNPKQILIHDLLANGNREQAPTRS